MVFQYTASVILASGPLRFHTFICNHRISGAYGCCFRLKSWPHGRLQPQRAVPFPASHIAPWIVRVDIPHQIVFLVARGEGNAGIAQLIFVHPLICG